MALSRCPSSYYVEYVRDDNPPYNLLVLIHMLGGSNIYSSCMISLEAKYYIPIINSNNQLINLRREKLSRHTILCTVYIQ